MQDLVEYLEELKRQCYIEGDFIVIDLGDKYDIALKRCSTPEAVLGWAHHLCEKTWMTLPVLRRFIDLATSHHGIKVQLPS